MHSHIEPLPPMKSLATVLRRGKTKISGNNKTVPIASPRMSVHLPVSVTSQKRRL